MKERERRKEGGGALLSSSPLLPRPSVRFRLSWLVLKGAIGPKEQTSGNFVDLPPFLSLKNRPRLVGLSDQLRQRSEGRKEGGRESGQLEELAKLLSRRSIRYVSDFPSQKDSENPSQLHFPTTEISARLLDEILLHR